MTTERNYKVYLFAYGILSVLFTLQFFEHIENYEECKKIIDAIKEQEKILNVELFTVINKENIQTVIDGFKPFGLTGNKAVENSIYYSELIVTEVINKNSTLS